MIGDAHAALAALKQRYEARLPSRLATVETLARSGAREELIELAHQLAGSAGLYGYEEVRAAAVAAERGLRSGAAVANSAAPLVDALSRAIASGDGQNA